MKTLFDTTTINGMTLNNRFVRSATYDAAASETGFVTPKMTNLMRRLADGGVGLILPGFAYVLKNGNGGPGMLGIYSDDHIARLRDMVDTVHNAGGIIAAQIVHCGVHSSKELIGEEPMGPSAIAPQEGKLAPFNGCRAMTKLDINSMIDAFAQAARRTQQAGFDAVQIHGAHGYLLSQFLSPFYNKRTDEYGGKVENRARIVLETYDAVRNTVGSNYPVLIKLNTTDFHAEGVIEANFLQVAMMLEKAGIDAIELSGGIGWNLYVLGDVDRTAFRSVKDEAYYRDIAQQLKQKIQIPVILTGGIKSYDLAQQIVDSKIADYIGLCRPLIREPDLVNRWKSGDTGPSECGSDNACVWALFQGKDLHCPHVAAE
jgi:2,4-dienoyl-CoA reductase-like NADH-dependent reductase (Old Yellow Enzyme family)